MRVSGPTTIFDYHLLIFSERTMLWTLAKFHTFRMLSQSRRGAERYDLGAPCIRRRMSTWASCSALTLPSLSPRLLHLSSSASLTILDSIAPSPGCPVAGSFHVYYKFWRLRLKESGFHVCSITERNEVQAQKKGELGGCGMGEPTMGTPWDGLDFSHLV